MTLPRKNDEYFELGIMDKMTRLSTLYWIEDAKGKHVKFVPNSVQMDLLMDLSEKNIVLKARQHGISTMVDILLLDEAVFTANTHCGIIAQTREDAAEIFRSKIKYPFDNLPKKIRDVAKPVSDSVNGLVFANGSTIRVGVSMRSSTIQMLHISEYGKICAKYPEKAREVRTGALNTVHAGQFVIIESTAEGRSGDFFSKCEIARLQKERGSPVGSMDYKFHFLAWWQHPAYFLPADEVENVIITDSDRKYFADLEAEHDVPPLTKAQMAWYVKKQEEQQDDMRREHPSYPEEAFAQAIEGAIYEKQLAYLRKQGRITNIEIDPRYPVYGAWDLGRRDFNSIWLFQELPGKTYHFVGYYENNGENIQHYGGWLKDWKDAHPGVFLGEQYLPHDAAVTDLTQGDNLMRSEVLESMGFRVETVTRIPQDTVSSGEGIQASRDMLMISYFDEEACARGLTCLGAYQREWQETMGAYSDRPLHNWASHGAKAFEQAARGHMSGRTKSEDERRQASGRGSLGRGSSGSRKGSSGRGSRSWKTT